VHRLKSNDWDIPTAATVSMMLNILALLLLKLLGYGLVHEECHADQQARAEETSLRHISDAHQIVTGDSRADDIWVSSVNPTGDYQCIVEAHGGVIWMYLHDLHRRCMIADAPVCSLSPLIELSEFRSTYRRGEPPPFVTGYCSPQAVCPHLMSEQLSIVWGRDHLAVATYFDGEPFSLIAPPEKKGYSKAILAQGPWGNPWLPQLYHEKFA
jgi:hypothetical protein